MGLRHLREPTRRIINTMRERQSRLLLRTSRRGFSGSLPPPSKAPPPPPATSSGLGMQKQIILGGALLGGSVYFLPYFEMTRKGVSAAFRYELPAGISNSLEIGIGASGAMLGYGIAETYLRRSMRLGNSSLTSSLKMPYAIFGSLLGAMISFNISDYIARYASKCAKVVEYAVEGMEHDFLGEDSTRGSIPTWENQNEKKASTSSSRSSFMDWWYGNGPKQNLDKRLEDIEASRRRLADETTDRDRSENASEEEVAKDAGATTTTTTTTEGKKVSSELKMDHVNTLAKGLAALRTREKILKNKVSCLSSDSPLRAEITKKIAELQQEKQELKDEALRVANVKLSKLLLTAVTELVDELSSIRLEQERLAAKIYLSDSYESDKLWRECRKMDARKQALKDIGYQYGEKISTMAERRPRWQKVANEGY